MTRNIEQTRTASAIETLASTAFGFGVSWAATPFILAWFGYQTTVGSSFGITAVYTALSLLRGYIVRRVFARIGGRL